MTRNDDVGKRKDGFSGQVKPGDKPKDGLARVADLVSREANIAAGNIIMKRSATQTSNSVSCVRDIETMPFFGDNEAVLLS